MTRLSAALVCLALALAGCGGASSPAHRTTASQALTSAPELLELDTSQARMELFREVAGTSLLQAGRRATGPVLFPLVADGAVLAAPGFETRMDFLQAPDAGQPLELAFDGQRWSEERRESLQGLSEREAAELVARSLITHWGLQPQGRVQVDRALGAPYAAAYVDGILRLNPAFVYLAASVAPSSGPGLQ